MKCGNGFKISVFNNKVPDSCKSIGESSDSLSEMEPASENEVALSENKVQDCSQSTGEDTDDLSDTEPASEGGIHKIN